MEMADELEKAGMLEKADAANMVEKADTAAKKADAAVEKGDALETLASNLEARCILLDIEQWFSWLLPAHTNPLHRRVVKLQLLKCAYNLIHPGNSVAMWNRTTMISWIRSNG
jgi:hypothetical protein